MSGESFTGKGGEFLVTPRQETGVHSLADVSLLDTVYEILDGSRFVVHDPLFPEPWIIGDGSRFAGLPDALVVDSLRHPHQAGNLQLVQDEPRATSPPLGNWSVLDHQIGTAMLARMIGLPDAFQAIAAVHDATKPVGGQPFEWNFEGCGVDSMSDMMMPRYMRAAGVLERLVEGGHVESDGWVPTLGMEFDWILKLNHTPPHAPEGTHPLNYPGRTGYLDIDRAQYIVGQAVRSLLDIPTAQALTAAMEYHGETAGFGPQIVVNDIKAAEMLFKFQTLEAVYDWGSALGIIGDMLFCRQLISHEIAAEPSYNLFDQMWTTQGIARHRLEADWDRNPLLSALHKIETAIADHIRKIYEDCMFNPAGYEQFAKAGLPLPEWLTIQPSTQKFTNQFEAIWPDVAPGNVGNFNYLLFDVHPGKLRYTILRTETMLGCSICGQI